MRELDRALIDIAVMRDQIARSCEFQGFGPTTLAITATLALAVAALQPYVLHDPVNHASLFVTVWFCVAGFSLLLIGSEALRRSKRVHGSMGLSMLKIAAEHFCPAIVAGGLLTVVLLETAPKECWMLPGLWQLLFCLGAFATARILPRPMFLVGVWYLVSGLACLEVGQYYPLSGWSMGVPFGVGQLLVCGILLQRRELLREI
jgi:hypothetical protein